MRYPQIVKLFSMISGDNGGCSADEIEEMLGDLTDGQLDTLATGESMDQEAIKALLRETHDAATVSAMDELLQVAFEGCACDLPATDLLLSWRDRLTGVPMNSPAYEVHAEIDRILSSPAVTADRCATPQELRSALRDVLPYLLNVQRPVGSECDVAIKHAADLAGGIT